MVMPADDAERNYLKRHNEAMAMALAAARSIVMPADDAERYYLKRHNEAMAMALAASDRSAQSAHFELARRYAERASASSGEPNASVEPSSRPILDQIATTVRTRR
jgi:hypothetical protein